MLVVTATELPRLMACNGSRLMAGFVPVVERDDTTRREGDAAHWLVKETHTGKITMEELIERKAFNGVFIDADMVEHVSDYAEAIKGGDVEVETTFAGQGWQVNGRADAIKYDPATCTLTIPDLKYGWSIVEPDFNWTLLAHAIGWAHRYSATHRIEIVRFEIYQPRPYHPLGTVRAWEITGLQLLEYVDELNRTLSQPNDQLNTGKHCYKCPALATCPAARKAQMNAIEASETAFVDNIDNENLSFQLDHLERAIKMLENIYDAYSDLAVHRLREGKNIANYGLDKSMSKYHWPEHITADILEAMTGKRLTEEKLVSPAQAIKKGASKSVVDILKTRHETGTKLVRIDVNKKANKLFNA